MALVGMTPNDTFKSAILDCELGNFVTFKSEDSKYNDKEAIAVIIDSEENKAVFNLVENGEVLTFDLFKLDENKYKITKIVDQYDLEYTIPKNEQKSSTISKVQIVSNDFDTGDMINVGQEVNTRLLGTYEIDWEYDDLKESLIEDLKLLQNGKSDSDLYNKISKKAELLLDISNEISIDGQMKKPLINNFINNNFSSYLLKPLVSDNKKVYVNTDFEEEGMKQYNNVHFVNFETEFMGCYEEGTKYNRGVAKDGIDRNQYLNNITYAFTYNKDSGDEVVILSGDRPYLLNKDTKNTYYNSGNLKKSQEIYRLCNPDDQCSALNLLNKRENITESISVSNRIAEGDTCNLEDVLTGIVITDRSSRGNNVHTCHGTGRIPEYYYSSSLNKANHKISEYNKSIIEPPIQTPIVSGEEVNIVGILLRSIDTYQPKFVEKNSYTLKGSPKYDGYSRKDVFPQIKDVGYNLVDHILFNEKNIKDPSLLNRNINENYAIHDEMSGLDLLSLDYSKNNFIYFNKFGQEVLKDNVHDYLDKIIPDLDEIYLKEESTFKKCSNFEDINRVLNKYNLSIFNSNVNSIKRINLKFLLRKVINMTVKNNKYNRYKKLEAKYNNQIFKTIINKIVENKDYLDKSLFAHFNSENIDVYSQRIISKITEKLSPIFRYEYTIPELENLIANKLYIIPEFNRKGQTEVEQYYNLVNIMVNIVVNKDNYNYNYYNNNYFQNIINYKNVYSSVSSIIDNLYKIYNLNTLDLTNIINNSVNLSLNDLKNIDLLNKLSKSFDGGDLIYKFFNNIVLENDYKITVDELHIIAKENYLSSNSGTGDEWESLQPSEKDNYIPSRSEISDELEKKKFTFNEQKKKYLFYLKRCESFEVIKLYRSVEEILEDNRKEIIFYNKEFDTTSKDCKLAKEILEKINNERDLTKNAALEISDIKIASGNGLKQELLKELKEKYIFNNEFEINDKFENIIENYDTENLKEGTGKRQVLDGSFALLTTATTRVLYKYIKKIWIPLNKQDILDKNICIFDTKDEFKTMMELDFDEFISKGADKYEDERVYDGQKLDELNRKCVSIDINVNLNLTGNNTKCVPKHFLNYIFEANKLVILLNKLVKLKQSRETLDDIITKNNEYISNKILSRQLLIKQKESKLLNNSNKTIEDNKNKIPNRLWDLFRNAINKKDPDHRLDDLKTVIDDYGVFNEPNSDRMERRCTLQIGDTVEAKLNYEEENWQSATVVGWRGEVEQPVAVEIRFDGSDDVSEIPIAQIEDLIKRDQVPSKNIYWDYPNTHVIMCCKHYLDIIEMAWVDNIRRNEILEEVKLKWCRKRIIEGDNIICDHCGEPVDKVAFSTFEGFSGSDKPVKFREEIIDEEEERYTKYTGLNLSIQKLLSLYCESIRVELRLEDIDFIIVNVTRTIQNRKITLDQYLNGDTVQLDIAGNFNGKTEGQTLRSKYETGYAEYKERCGGTIPNNTNLATELLKNGLELKNQNRNLYLFCKFLVNIIENYYITYCDCQKISILLTYLYFTIIYSIPPYKVLGTGSERIAKVTFYQFNESNMELNIKYLIKSITGNFINNNPSNDLISWSSLNKKPQYLRLTTDDTTYTNFRARHFTVEFDNIQNIEAISYKRDAYEKYTLDIFADIKQISKNEENWGEFRPILNVKYEYNEVISIDNIISAYKATEQEINTLIESRQDKESLEYNENLNQLTENLIRNRQDLLDNSRKIGYKIISLINTTIHSQIHPLNIQTISYISSCCPNFIYQKYTDYFQNNTEINADYIDLFEKSLQSNKLLKDISNNNSDFVLTFNKYNTYANHEHVSMHGIGNVPELPDRTLLDYMYISEKTFDNDQSRYLEYLQGNIRQINHIVITNQFNDIFNEYLIGKRRIWVEHLDQDYNILSEIYKEAYDRVDKKPNTEELSQKLKAKLEEKYSTYEEEYINRKVELIINHEGKCLLDVVSNQYDYEINKHIDDYIRGKDKIQLQEEIEKLVTQSKIQNILYKSSKYKEDDIIDNNLFYNFYNTELNLVSNIQDLMKKIYVNRFKDLDYFESIQKSVNNFKQKLSILDYNSGIESKDDREFTDEIIGIHQDHFGSDTSVREGDRRDDMSWSEIEDEQEEYIITISKPLVQLNQYLKLKGFGNDIDETYMREFLESFGEFGNIQEEELTVLEENLTIEEYIEPPEERKREKDFREREIKNNNFSKKINKINKTSKMLLNIIISIVNKLKNRRLYLETYENEKKTLTSKIREIIPNNNSIQPWWITNFNYIRKAKCICPTPNNYLNNEELNVDDLFFDKYYSIIDQCIKDIIDSSEHNKDDLDSIINNIENNLNIGSLLDLINLLVSKNSNFNCNNKLKFIPVLNNETVFIISKYLFYNILNLIFVTLNSRDPDSINNILLATIYNFVFNENLFKNQELQSTNNNIQNIINNYNSDRNRRRKNDIESMDKEMRNSYKLYRKLNLGNIFESESSSKYNLETEELFHDSGNSVHDNVSKANMIESYGEDLPDFINQQQLDTEAYEEHFSGNTDTLYGQAEHIGEDGVDFDIN